MFKDEGVYLRMGVGMIRLINADSKLSLFNTKITI